MPLPPNPDASSPGQVLRYRDSAAAGLSPGRFRREVRGLHRLTAGSYAAVSGLSPEASHELAAREVVARLSGVAVSHMSAAVLWDLPLLRPHLDVVHLTTTEQRRGRPRSRPAYQLHGGQIREPWLVWRRRLPVTSPARTVSDCARLLGTDWGVVLADAALRRGLVEPGDLEHAADSVRSLRGAAFARAVPDLSSPMAQSPGETLLRLRLRRLGRTPRAQVPLVDVPGVPRVDFLVGRWLVIEFDGRAKYDLTGDAAAAHWAEKLRQDPMVEAGYEVLRVVWAELFDEGALLRRITAAEYRVAARHG